MPINLKKLLNLKSLIQYIPKDKKQFFNLIFEYPTTAIKEPY